MIKNKKRENRLQDNGFHVFLSSQMIQIEE
jgi:hypothetical protein